MPTSQRETGERRAEGRTQTEPDQRTAVAPDRRTERESQRRADADPERRRGRQRWTTIVLEETATGWRAARTGVDVGGRGGTAVDAAADYCRRVSSDERSGPNAEGPNA